MAHKHVLFRSAAREKILRSPTLLADAIRVTLGPKSNSVLIQKRWGAPIICDDGVTIVKEFDLVEAGIIDPTKFVRIALENAVSVAGVPLLTEAVMTEIPETIRKDRAIEPEMAL